MTSRRKQDELRHTVRVPRRAFGRGARARARRACRSAGLRRARIRPHRDADARGHGRHAGRRAAARLAVSVLRRAWRPAGHASRRRPCRWRACAPRAWPTSRAPCASGYTQRVFREAETEMQATAPRAHADRHRVHRRGRHAGRRGGGEPSGAGARSCRRAPRSRLAIATVGVLRALLDRSGAQPAWRAQVLEAYHASNFVELDRLTDAAFLAASPDAAGVAPGVRAGRARAGAHPGRARGHRPGARAGGTPRLRGRPGRLRVHVRRFGGSGAGRAHPRGLSRSWSAFDYYTGIVFEAYAPQVGTPLGSGGRYDNMIGAYGDPPSRRRLRVLFRTGLGSGFGFRRPTGRRNNPCASRCPKAGLNPDAVEALGAAGLDVEGLDNPGGS